MKDNPGVIAPPPLIALTAIAIGFALEAFWPMNLTKGNATTIIGAVVFVIGFLLACWAFATFRRARTNIPTRSPSTTVVATGPYRFTRNPIYIGMALGIIGVGLAADSVWVVAMMVPFIAVIDRGVIAREERYLSKKFPNDYPAYRGRVRRWI